MGDKHLGLAKESSWGVNPGFGSAAWFEILSEGVKIEPRYIAVNTIRSVAPRAQSLGSSVTRGPIRGLVNYQDFPSLAYYMLGDNDSSAGPAPYTHTIPKASAPAFIRPSATIQIQRDVGDGGETFKYQGCVMTELGLVVAINEVSEFSAAFVGKGTGLTGTPDTPTYPTLDLLLPTQAIVSVDSVAKNVERWTLQISWPVDEPNALGTTAMVRKPRDADVMKVSGSFVLLQHDAADVFTKFSSFGDVDLQLQASGASADVLTINVNKVKLLTGHGHLEGRTTPKPEIQWEAFLDPGILSAIQIVGINDKATLP